MAGARTITRLLGAGAVAVLAIGWGSGTAGAELADGATVTVTPDVVERGDDFTISGTGCTGEQAMVLVEIDGEFVDAVSADEDGDWATEQVVPDDVPSGTYDVRATCDTYGAADQYPVATVTVVQLPVDPPTQPPPPQVGVSASTATAGSTVTVTGSGFASGEQVSVTLFSDPVHLATVTASATGTVSVAVKIPAGTPAGSHRIELRGVTTGRVGSVPVTVAAKPTGSTLARTGDTNDLLAKVAASLILAGVGTIAIATGRRELLS